VNRSIVAGVSTNSSTSFRRRVAVDPTIELQVIGAEPTIDPHQPAFLLVHGLASNARLWDGVITHLSEAGHPVYAVDQRGHGQSDAPDRGYDLVTAVADLVAVIQGLEITRPVVVGQSWGGNVVVELAARHPELVSGISCVDGGFIELQEIFDRWEDCAQRLAPPRLDGSLRTTLADHLNAAHPDWASTAIDGALANFATHHDGTISPHLTFERHMLLLRALWDHRPSVLFPKLSVPVLWMPADDGTTPDALRRKQGIVDRAERLLSRSGTAHSGTAHNEIALNETALSRTQWFVPADHDVHAQYPDRVAAALLLAAHDGFFS
jgi:pimeloyl-ACP methyl ester carboxylesterase